MTQNTNRPPVRRPQQGAPAGRSQQGAQTRRPQQGAQTRRPQQGAPTRRPAPARRPTAQQSPKKGGGLSTPVILLAVGVVIVVLGILLQYKLMPDGYSLNTAPKDVAVVAEIHASNTVKISEVMSSNGSTVLNESGESCDWLEIYNSGTEEVNLLGWTIGQSANSVSTFTFPKHVLQPGEYVLMLADGTLRNTYGYTYHLPFRLKAAGDTLMLFNANGTAVESINVPDLSRNEVYRLVDGNWGTSYEYTPGMANTQENYNSLQSVSTAADVAINELMASNATYAKTEQGYFDYIELHNKSQQDVDLSGWYLSDSGDRPTKWRFPDGTGIPAGGYLIVYASGLDTGLHTNFKLSSEGEDVVLSNASGQPVDSIAYDILQTDQAYSRQPDGTFITSLSPTPGMANTTESAALIESQFAAQNTMGITINEVLASTTTQNYDWVEIYNSSKEVIDLSGYGVSDDAGKPRKWQFPADTQIQPGEYLGLFFSGLTGKSDNGLIHVDFKLSIAGGYAVTLSTPAGEIFERLPLGEQYTNISYGRVPGKNGLYYMSETTPGAQNSGTLYQGKAQMATSSVAGGVQQAPITVDIAVPNGNSRVYYTLDSSEPDETDMLYTRPIEISATTVLRTRVYQDNLLPSYIDTQTYFYGISHDMRVVSLVCEPDELFDETTGLYQLGPNAEKKYPYKGANYWSEAEIEGHVEMFALDGSSMISQGCGVRLHGQYSRARNQKAFKVIASSEYSGKNRFSSSIFENRSYTEYQSFLLRASGQDDDKSRMRDSVLQALAQDTSVMYMETELCVVYINGVYWGHYNIRERINKFSICQFEGWEGQEDDIDLVKANSRVMQGSNDSYAEMLEWVKKNGINDDATLDRVGQVIDLQNYIEYHALQIFVGNGDTLNVKRYRNANEDGKWRYCLFDLDWAFFVDTDSIARWLNPGGMGTNKYTDNALFIALMKNDTFRDRFLTYMGEQMGTNWTTKNLLELFETRYNALQSEMPRHMERWDFTQDKYSKGLTLVKNYCINRPSKLLMYTQEAMNLSDADMQKYFGGAIQAIRDRQQ